MDILRRYRDFIVYTVFGALATALNAGLYQLFYVHAGMTNVVSTISAWTITLIFTFVTNKFFVYRSKECTMKGVLAEAWKFFLCRSLSGVFDTVFMYVSVDICHFVPLLMKLIASVFVGLINYFGGKLLIFRTR
ncbi:MAG: GtrA family protein [Bullifex sp.]